MGSVHARRRDDPHIPLCTKMTAILQIKNIHCAMDFAFTGQAVLWYKGVVVMVRMRGKE